MQIMFEVERKADVVIVDNKDVTALNTTNGGP